MGERTWTPTGPAAYRLGVGEATLDLREVTLAEGSATDLRARVDVGELTIIVPRDTRVAVAMHADIGELSVPGLLSDGVLLDRLHTRGINLEDTDLGGRDVDRELIIGPEGATQIHVDASVRFGQITVIRRG
jgi:hypothetical protein